MDNLEQFKKWLEKRGYDYNWGMGYIGPGWLPLLDDACNKLEEAGWNKEILQIKEKFGSLRFYIKGTRKHYNIVNKAEIESGVICEQCGRPGRKSNDNSSWITTRCETCQ